MNKTYTYEELNPKAKEKAIENYREEFQNYRNEDFFEIFNQDLIHLGFENLEPKYSFSYSQGDGCSVYGKIFIDEILNNNEIIENFTKSELRRIKYICNSLEYKIILNNNNYYHHNSIDIDGYVDSNYYTHRDIYLIENVFEKLLDILEKYLIDFCINMEDFGYSFIYDDYAIADEIINNELEFYEDGSLYTK